MRATTILFFLFISISTHAQIQWTRVDSLYGPLPKSVHAYFTKDRVDTAPFRAFYLIADLKDKKLDFTTDTTYQRRLTPQRFYEKNHQPLVVVNGTFFSFQTNRNLNVVIRNGKTVAFNQSVLPARGRDTLTYWHTYGSAIGLSKKRKPDVAWLITDSTSGKVYATQSPLAAVRDSNAKQSTKHEFQKENINGRGSASFKKWKMRTAIGGGPVLLQEGRLSISNNEERKFGGKAINDKHPRTAMGYTRDNKLIILVMEGRNQNAAGATLPQLAKILQDLGCVEALNLDGGGSSCMLVNGKETIRPSDKVQRAVPGVFVVSGEW